MSDDLVKRLRQGGTYQHDTVPMQKAADRIEQLEAANLKAALIKVDDMARIEQLEAALRRIRLHSREAWECKIANEALDAK